MENEHVKHGLKEGGRKEEGRRKEGGRIKLKYDGDLACFVIEIKAFALFID